jgi:hypothetical protein
MEDFVDVLLLLLILGFCLCTIVVDFNLETLGFRFCQSRCVRGSIIRLDTSFFQLCNILFFGKNYI